MCCIDAREEKNKTSLLHFAKHHRVMYGGVNHAKYCCRRKHHGLLVVEFSRRLLSFVSGIQLYAYYLTL
jgi:hypothetical protein